MVYINLLACQGPDALNARLEAFMQFEANTIESIQNSLASAMPIRYVAVPDEDSPVRPFMLSVKTFEGRENQIILSEPEKLKWQCLPQCSDRSINESR